MTGKTRKILDQKSAKKFNENEVEKQFEIKGFLTKNENFIRRIYELCFLTFFYFTLEKLTQNLIFRLETTVCKHFKKCRNYLSSINAIQT